MEQLENGIWNKEKPTKIAERFKFFKRDQLKEETIAIYLDELKKLVTTCEFSAYLEEALCDRFVCGIQDEIIQADLLTKHDLTLDGAIQYALTMEVVRYSDESKPVISHKEEEEDEDFENCHSSLDIKEELEPVKQEEFEVRQEFLDLQNEPNLLVEAECDQQILQLDDGKKKFECEFCQKTFLINSRLMDHRRIHTGEKPFICITCNKSFARKETLRRHTKKLLGCADYDKQKLTFEKHVKVKAERQKVEYTCDVCCRAFPQKGVLKRHFRIHTGEKPYECAVCKTSFNRKSSLKRHLRVHGFKKPLRKKTLKCQTCRQTFLKKTDLEKHLKSHTEHGNPNEKMNLLDQEDTKTDVMDSSTIDLDKTELLERQASLPKKTRKKTKSFLCHMCDYRTYKNHMLERHIKRHTGERPFPCDMCSYKAVCRSHLTTHKRIHSTEKLFICEICGYKTNYNDKLRVHIRIHTGEKPFHCKFCDYKCAERNSLRNHERIHTGEKPFSCNFCDYRAAQRTGLVYHLRTHKKNRRQSQNS